MPTYFTLAELLKSNTAKTLGIDNTPTWDVVENLRNLTDTILDPLRASWGGPIRVSSGYRCPALNAAIKGASATSVHMRGSAADIKNIGGGTFTEFKDFVVKWLKNTGTKFDQLLIERNSSGDMWLHVGQFNNAGQQRGIIKNMEV